MGVEQPALLSETGLYSDIASKMLAPGIQPFEPSHSLWSDGAEKSRWVFLPDCETIDTSDMDNWSVPVGTKLFKEFVVDGKRIETRLIARTGPGRDDFLFGAYLWNEEETEGTFVELGERNAKGTTHDVPAVSLCEACHERMPGRILGFSAAQLNQEDASGGFTIDRLVSEGRLSRAPELGATVPGDATTQAVLGYLHANCSHCHNATEDGVEFINAFDLRITWDDMVFEDTGVYNTAFDVPVEKFVQPGITHRVVPGDSSSSGIPTRMGIRGTLDQMPPILTKEVDEEALAMVRDWIDRR